MIYKTGYPIDATEINKIAGYNLNNPFWAQNGGGGGGGINLPAGESGQYLKLINTSASPTENDIKWDNVEQLTEEQIKNINDIPNIKKSVTDNTEDIDTINNTLNNTVSSVESLNRSLDTTNTNVSNNTNAITDINNDITDINKTIDGINSFEPANAGAEGQYLTKTTSGYEWQDIINKDLPATQINITYDTSTNINYYADDGYYCVWTIKLTLDKNVSLVNLSGGTAKNTLTFNVANYGFTQDLTADVRQYFFGATSDIVLRFALNIDEATGILKVIIPATITGNDNSASLFSEFFSGADISLNVLSAEIIKEVKYKLNVNNDIISINSNLTNINSDITNINNDVTTLTNTVDNINSFEPSNEGAEGQFLMKTANNYRWEESNPTSPYNSNVAVNLADSTPDIQEDNISANNNNDSSVNTNYSIDTNAEVVV